MYSEDLARFEQIHADATELLRLRSRAVSIRKPDALGIMLRQVLPTEPKLLERIDRALKEPIGTVHKLSMGLVDPLTCDPRAMVLLGRSLDLDLDTWLCVLTTSTRPFDTWVSQRLELVREQWIRAAEDDPLSTE